MMIQQQLTNDTTLLALANRPKKKSLRKPHQSTIQQLRSSATIKSHHLQCNTTHEVLLSDVQDGPLKFNIQVESCALELETLMSNLQYLPRKPMSDPLFSGNLCLALHSKTNSLRRAVISQVISTHEAEVMYCDFGDREILQHSSIYEIPLQYLNPQAFSVTFTLSGVDRLDVTTEMKSYFKQLVLGKKLTLIVMPSKKSSLVHYGDLLIENKSVLKLLVEAFPSSANKFPEVPYLTSGTRESVHVSYVHACSKFFVNLAKNVLDMESLSNHLTECIEVPVKETNIKPGMICLAHSSAYSKWYRAEVLNVADNHVTVHYVDYGNDEMLSYNAIRSICCNEIMKVPIQAVYCVLNGFESVPYNTEIDDEFGAYVLDKPLVIVVHEVKSSGIIVDLYDSNVQPILNISEKLRGILGKTSPPRASQSQPTQIYTAQCQEDVIDNSKQSFHEKSSKVNGSLISNEEPSNSCSDSSQLEQSNPGCDEQIERIENDVPNPVTADVNTTELSSNEYSSSALSPVRIPFPNITLGDIQHCEIVCLTSATDFYVQLKSNNLELNSIMDRIEQIYATGGKNLSKSNAKVGMNCVAQYSDDLKWYRVVIQSINQGIVTIRFVDYGNVRAVTFDKVKELDEELAKLPAQAINCKLFDAKKNTWEDDEITEFESRTEMKLFEIEFIAQENNTYEVLIREIVENEAVGPYLNEIFSNDGYLLQAKKVIKNKNLTTKEVSTGHHVTLKRKWIEPVINLPSEEDVIVTWLIDPDDFYCHLLGTSKDFRSMMNEIQNIYSKRQPTLGNIAVGSSVIAFFAGDEAFYRAEVIQAVPGAFVVRYVDFGNTKTVKSSQIYPADEKFMNLPKQAVPCCLKNVVPRGIRWSNASYDEIDLLFSVEYLRCKFEGGNTNKYLVSLTYNGQDLSDTLVKKKLADAAKSHDAENTVKSNSPQIEMSFLRGQKLRVRVLKVESVNKFYIELPTSKSGGKVTNNHKVECSLNDADSSSTTNDILKNLTENKEVIVCIHEVNNNRLVVELFNTSGKRIEIQSKFINPFCSMPIFCKQYSVLVPHVKNCSSVWLTRDDDIVVFTTLHDELLEHYSKFGKPLNIEGGILCAAQSSDGNWYRARIIEKTSSGGIVHYLDFGNREEVPFDKIKELAKKFLRFFQLAIEVQLAFNIDDKVIEQEILHNHVLNQSFDATLQLNDKNKWTASLSLKSGELLENHLRNLGLFD